MTKKTKPGVLDARVAFRLSRADHLDFLAKVKASGKSRSDYFRQCVLNSTVSTKGDDNEAKAAKARLLYLANKTSNNLNQLAHRANADHLAGLLSEHRYLTILFELQHIAALFNAAIDHAD